ncbi:hypothetical protein JCM5296_004188 [Sporobolomyces johnsonii]
MPSSYAPNTLIARWPTVNPQSALPLLARTINANLQGTSLGRRALHIRPLRLPAPKGAPHEQGRNLYVLRSLEGTHEHLAVVVEDPAAPLRGQSTHRDDDDDLLFTDDDDQQPHTRWTYSAIASPPSSSASSPQNPSALFDSFIQRVLIGAAPPSSTNPLGSGPPSQPFWHPRPTAIFVESGAFAVSANPVTSPGSHDWLIKVGSVTVKGGTSSGTTRGCIIEVSYLPVPYLPASSTYVKDFLLALFPAAAVRNGEIEVLDVKEEDLVEAGVLEQPDKDKGEEEGEWEWRERHSLFSYVQQFKKEGLL